MPGTVHPDKDDCLGGQAQQNSKRSILFFSGILFLFPSDSYRMHRKLQTQFCCSIVQTLCMRRNAEHLLSKFPDTIGANLTGGFTKLFVFYIYRSKKATLLIYQSLFIFLLLN